jgi:hypothetical protein
MTDPVTEPGGVVRGELPVGTRLRCIGCGAELIVVGAAEVELSCCGGALEPVGPARR